MKKQTQMFRELPAGKQFQLEGVRITDVHQDGRNAPKNFSIQLPSETKKTVAESYTSRGWNIQPNVPGFDQIVDGATVTLQLNKVSETSCQVLNVELVAQPVGSYVD